MEEIQVFDALRQVRDFKPFAITFVKYSMTKKKGGEIVSFSNVVMMKKVNNSVKHHQITIRIPEINEIRTIYVYSILAINGKKIVFRNG